MAKGGVGVWLWSTSRWGEAGAGKQGRGGGGLNALLLSGSSCREAGLGQPRTISFSELKSMMEKWRKTLSGPVPGPAKLFSNSISC